jgi:hypothetical protein
MDPHNSKMREAMAHMLREAQTVVGSGDPSGRSAPPMLTTPQSQAGWVQQVLAHVPSRDKAECLSYWPCMESSQERRVSEMELDHLVWAPL